MHLLQYSWVSLVAQMVKNLPAMLGDLSSIPGLGRSPGGGHGNPLQYSCLENSMDRGAWQVIVHRVAKSQTQLKQLSMDARMTSKLQNESHINIDIVWAEL